MGQSYTPCSRPVARTPISTRSAGPSSFQRTERPLDLAAAIVAAMQRKGYIIDTQPGEINIVYVEGLNEDGTVNDDAADKWNDLRVVIGFEGDKPVILAERDVASVQQERSGED